MQLALPRSSYAILAALLLLLPAAVPAQEDATPAYAGDEACTACHEDLGEPYGHTIHAKVLTERNAHNALMRQGCEACHGPASQHVAEGGGRGVGGLVSFRAESPEAIGRENAVCLTCHARGRQVHWSGSVHESRDLACTSCHVLMKNLSDRHQLAAKSETQICTSCHLVQRGELNRNHHHPIREGFLECTSCHNPHGTVTEKLLVRESTNDTCYGCHADKRGPFLWEHPPVTENCLNCHEAHGSVREAMLKLSMPRLCQQCHVATQHPSQARTPGDRFVIGRSCVQCHQAIHGSNHPSGYRYTR
jgi:DmsE family decaheme c-type cytochrome